MKRPFLISKNGYLHIAIPYNKFDDKGNLILDKNGKPKVFRKTMGTGHPATAQGKSKAAHDLELFKKGELAGEAFTPVLLSEYLTRYNRLYSTKNPKSLKQYEYAVNSLIYLLGNKYMHTYTVSEIDNKFIAVRKQEIEGITLSKQIRHLKTLFSRAKKHKHIINNPFEDTISIDIPQAFHRTFEDTEYKTLIKTIEDPQDKNLITALIYTGMRISELLRQKLSDIDGKFIHVVETKTKKERFIEMHDNVKPSVNAAKGQVYWFERHGKPMDLRSTQDRIKEYLRASGLDPKLTAKAMRKTFGSWLLEKGVPIEFIADQMGNSVQIALKHYAKYKKRDYKGWVNKM